MIGDLQIIKITIYIDFASAPLSPEGRGLG
jgi:hypothetical protein